MKSKIILLLLCAILQSCSKPIGGTSTANASSNGSSGIGNMVALVGNIQAHMATANSIQVENNTVIDGKSGEKLIQIEQVPQSTGPNTNTHLVSAQLGALKGFEYLPQTGSTAETNHWIICGDDQKCYKFSPLSNTNPKVSAIIGSLSRSE